MGSDAPKVAVVTVATVTIPRFRIDMIEEFVRRGCEVVVMGNEPSEAWSGYMADHGAWYRQYRVSRNGMNPVADVSTTFELARLLREERPDKVFTYQAKGNIYGAIAAHGAGVREVYPMVGGLGSVFNARDARSRAVARIVECEYRMAMRHATRVFFQNGEDAARFRDLRIVEDGQVVLTHGSGVNLERFPRRPLPEEPSFLFVGRLVRSKGIMDFLEAARMVKAVHPDVRFDVVGPFDTNPTCITESELRPYVEDGTVAYHGEQDDVRPFYERCSAFVLPSYYGEGTPKSALEAMATGRPLIVADAVGCREVVRPGENGFLVPPCDPKSLAAAITNLITDRLMVARMSDASYALAEKTFDVRKVNKAICDTMGIERMP